MIKKIKKTIIRTDTDEHEKDHAWIYTRVKLLSCLFPALSIGRSPKPTSLLRINVFGRRVKPCQEDRNYVFTDGDDNYRYVDKSFFPIENINYYSFAIRLNLFICLTFSDYDRDASCATS